MHLDHIIKIDDVLVNKEITEVKFACDLSKCKGACCTMESSYGAPLLKEEIGIIESLLPVVKEYIPEEHMQEIEKNGFWEEKSEELMTRSVNDRACVFVYFENDIAKCAIEKAYKEGKVNFIKPISCHLFPIRVSKFGGDILRYEKIDECKDALVNGKKQDFTIAQFCRSSLIRSYGERWYNTLNGGSGK